MEKWGRQREKRGRKGARRRETGRRVEGDRGRRGRTSPTLMTLFNLNFLLKGLFSKFRHSEGQDFNM